MSKVSVIIPAYNAERYILRCVSSVMEQSYRDVEIIVINDGSTDDTKEVVEKLSSRDSRIKIINTQNSGRAKARNRGIAAAHGEWLAFLDADDYWREDKLEKQLNVALGEGSGLVYSQRTWVDEHENVETGYPIYQLPTGLIFESLIEGNYLCTSTVIVKRILVEQAGFFSEKANLRNCQDYDLWIRLSVLTTFSAIEDALTFYRLHENNAHKDYGHRYVGLRACMERLRQVAISSGQDSTAVIEKIDTREAKICEAYGVIFFKHRQFSRAYEAFSSARSMGFLSGKRTILMFLCKLLKGMPGDKSGS